MKFEKPLQTNEISFKKRPFFQLENEDSKIAAFASQNENFIFQRVGVGDSSVWKTFSNVFMNVSEQYGSRASVIDH